MTTQTRIIGLDGEMSGNDIAAGYKLIQIGVAVDTDPQGNRLAMPELFCSLIGWDEADLPWCPRAAAVHKIPREVVLAAPRAAEVDAALAAWLLERGVNRPESTMCGFNVGAFDSPFVAQALPTSRALFARRYADLNSATMLLTSATQVLGGPADRSGWKRHLTKAGQALVTSVGRAEPEHDAGTDALLALGAWRHGQAIIAQLDEDAAAARRARRAERKARALAADAGAPAREHPASHWG